MAFCIAQSARRSVAPRGGLKVLAVAKPVKAAVSVKASDDAQMQVRQRTRFPETLSAQRAEPLVSLLSTALLFRAFKHYFALVFSQLESHLSSAKSSIVLSSRYR